MKLFTRLRVRSSTLSELGNETKVNLMVVYKEFIKSVNSLGLTGTWVKDQNVVRASSL